MIEQEDREGVRCLWLNTPPSNSLTLAMLKDIRAAVTTEDPSIRCLMFGSRIDKYFSSGLDLDAIFSLPPESRIDIFVELLETHRTIARFPGPSIAALGGSAVLGGWILAMACDFRWMSSETGRLALSEIRYGLTPTEFLIARLRSMGTDPVLTKQVVLRGKTIKAEEALAGRFVDRLVPASELRAQALQEARRLAKLPPQAYHSVKQALWGPQDPELWERSIKEFKRIFNGPEACRGLEAMKKKKMPRWES